MKIEDAISTGSKIEIEILKEDNKFVKYSTLVDRSFNGDDFTIVTPMSKGNYVGIPVDSVVSVIFMVSENNTKEPYTFKARVTNRAINNTNATVTLCPISEPEKHRRRGAFRLSLVKTITILVGDEMRPVEVTTKNLSATGLRGIVGEKLPVKSKVLVDLTVKDKSLKIHGEVIDAFLVKDSIKNYDTRINFTDIDERLKSQIAKYLIEKQSESLRKNLDKNGYSELFLKMNGEGDNYIPEDNYSKSIGYISAISFAILICTTAFLFNSMPRIPLALERLFNYRVPSQWNTVYLNYASFTAAITIVLNLASLFFNSIRNRMYGERYRLSVIFLLVINILILLFSQIRILMSL